MASQFANLAKNFEKAKKLYDEAKGASEKRDKLIKLSKMKDAKDREKLIKEILDVASGFGVLIDAATKVREQLTAISNQKTKWPECNGGNLYAAGLMAVYKHGVGSKQAKTAWAAYAKHLDGYTDALNDELDALNAILEQVPKRKKAADTLVTVSGGMSKGFDMVLKLPLPTATQAKVFSLSEDAGLLYAQALNVLNLLEKIEDRVKSEVKEGESILVMNLKWYAWSLKAAGLEFSILKRNANAKVPR